MAVFLNRKGLETTLPNVAARTVMTMVAADVAGEQPLHPAAQVAVVTRPKHQVEVIVQQAKGEDAHRQPLVRQGDRLDECRKVAVFVKHVAPRIAAVQNVVSDAAYGSSRSSWHASQDNTIIHMPQH